MQKARAQSAVPSVIQRSSPSITEQSFQTHKLFDEVRNVLPCMRYEVLIGDRGAREINVFACRAYKIRAAELISALHKGSPWSRRCTLTTSLHLFDFCVAQRHVFIVPALAQSYFPSRFGFGTVGVKSVWASAGVILPSIA